MNSSWRLIVERAQDAFTNMAIDEAVLMHCIEGVSAPTLRFYEWEKPSISIGYGMDVEEEANLSLCRERGVPLVRRMTGGGLVFHKCDITYTAVFPEDFCPEQGSRTPKRLSVLESYRLVNGAIAEGLKELGIDTSLLGRDERKAHSKQETANVCFSNPTVYDILHDGRKLAGSAQRRKKGWILHQGSMLFSSDFVSMCAFLPPVRSGARARAEAGALQGRPAAQNPMAATAVCLEEILGGKPQRDEIVDALSEGFARALGVNLERAPLRKSELDMAEQLCKEKYSTDDWNLRRLAK